MSSTTRTRRASTGKCRTCGARASTPGYATCEPCRKEHREYVARRNAELAAEGKCRYCQASASSRLCEDCERRAKRSGRVVYFLRAFVGHQAMIKVGSTAKLRRRVVELQTASPVRLHVLAAVPGGEPKERELHRLLAPFRSHGEWYRGEPEVMEVVAAAKRRKG